MKSSVFNRLSRRSFLKVSAAGIATSALPAGYALAAEFP